MLYPRGAVAPKRLLLVGLGKREKATAETIRRASATAVKEAQKLQGGRGNDRRHTATCRWTPELTAQAFAEGIELGAYRFWRYRTGLTAEQTFEVEQRHGVHHDQRANQRRASPPGRRSPAA